jgi:hypothetical protein
MQNLVNEESSFKQARSLPTSEYLTDSLYINVPSKKKEKQTDE